MTFTESKGLSFDFGRVMSRTLSLIKRNFVPFFVLSLVLGGAPYLVLLLVMPALILGGPDAATLAFAVIALVLVYLIAALVLQAALTRASVDDLSGKPVGLGAALSTGVALILPMLGLGLVVGGVVVVGAIIFGVGMSLIGFGMVGWPMILLTIVMIGLGVYLFLRWIVSAPVLVIERIGVFPSLRRSSALTENHRWAIFGLLVLYAIFVLVLQFVAGLVFPGAEATMSGVPSATTPFVSLVALVLIQAVTSMIVTVLIASVYFELRQLKDGVGVSELANVFA